MSKVTFEPVFRNSAHLTPYEIANILSAQILNERYNEIIEDCKDHPEGVNIFTVANQGQTIEAKQVCCERFRNVVLERLRKDAADQDNQ